ncbi:hypothetical protein RQP46_010319 [Phenoliferia psychrophenolica]
MHLTALVKEFGPGIELQIYERNKGIGGTWHNNTYPGVACDVPSHGYSLSWAPWPDWPQFQAPGAATLKYCEFVAEKCGVRDVTRFQTNIDTVTWDKDLALWKVSCTDVATGEKFTDEANVFVNASGLLSQPKFPDVADLDKFEGGEVLHSALWKPEVDLSGKRIALVGAGSSSIQILSAIQKQAGHIDQYIRSSTWITPVFGSTGRAEFFNLDPEDTLDTDDPEKANPKYTKEQIKIFQTDPVALNDHRKSQASEVNGLFASDITITGSPMQIAFKALVEKLTRDKLTRKPELADLFVPTWPIGCRRATPGVGYLSAVQADNVEVVRGSVVRATKKGLIASDGKEREYDVVILATGFNTTFAPSFKVTGLDGWSPNTNEEYLKEPSSYMIVSTQNLPNYFTVHGPLVMSFNGDFLAGQERTMNYIFKFILKMQLERYKSVVVKQEAVDSMMAYADAYLPRTVHTESCNAWYKNDGKVRAIWPGSVIHLMHAMEHPRWEEFDWERLDEDKKNPAARYAYFGAGRTYEELEGVQLAQYLPVVKDPYAKVPAFGTPTARLHFESWEK